MIYKKESKPEWEEIENLRSKKEGLEYEKDAIKQKRELKREIGELRLQNFLLKLGIKPKEKKEEEIGE